MRCGVAFHRCGPTNQGQFRAWLLASVWITASVAIPDRNVGADRGRAPRQRRAEYPATAASRGPGRQRRQNGQRSAVPPDRRTRQLFAAAAGPTPPPPETAAERTVTREEIAARPITRPAEVLEAAPGLIITQHSGEGKANQYFLRGYNLDHGTDLAIFVDEMPINMRTHAHGQGYSDLNFLIPKLVASMEVRKGPYYADEGDFSSVGALHINLLDKLEKEARAIHLREASAISASFPTRFGAVRLWHIAQCRLEAEAYIGPLDES